VEEQIIIEDGVPAIVSKELWEKAQVACKYMARASSNAKHQYLLSGLLWWGCRKLEKIRLATAPYYHIKR